MCLFDHQLVSRFEWLRHGKPPDVATPPLFMAFDCLHAARARQDLRPLALHARRAQLEAVIQDEDLVLPVRRLAAHGLAAWNQVRLRGCEGLVAKAKDPASPYVGGRTLRWLKAKQPKYREEVRGFCTP